MTTFWTRISRLVGLADPEEIETLERSLRLDFRKRCSLFRQLVGSNNLALEVMSEIEELLRGATPFGVPQIRGMCALTTANVFKMIRCLNGMTNGRYNALFGRLRAIQEEMGRHVEGGREPLAGPLVLPLGQIGAADSGEVGPKMANLGELGRIGLAVPRGFVITASAFRRFFEHAGLTAEIEGLIRERQVDRLDERYALSSTIQEMIVAAPLPDDLLQDIEGHCQALARDHGDEVRLAIRSSALGEDLPDASFAGQYRTELGVRLEQVARSYKEVVASKYGVAAMTYRWNRGIPDEGMAVCVGCLLMVDAAAGGVVYTLDPVNPVDHRLVIHAAPGLPTAVVDGNIQADRYLVSRDDPPRIVQSHVPRKDSMAQLDAQEGIAHIQLQGRDALAQAIDTPVILDLCRKALAVERHFGQPQDVEWVLDRQGALVFLQARPMTSHASIVLENEDTPGLPLLLSDGEPASPGAACGKVFVVRKNADAFSFPEGAVLVTAQALPRWAPLLSKAVAVVAETGSAAGHLANVAREFDVPAVFGLENAVSLLEGSEMVTVDGTHGRVYSGCAESLLADQAEKRPGFMLGSPVMNTLASVARHIVPLTLLDPESPDFTPEYCRTLHDITRFCHEKSVGELFAADSGPVRNRLAKQLRYRGRPLKYWLIDLGNGFRNPPQDRFIDFENIASRPLHVLWEGMTAKDWSGPPMLDVRGFAAIISQAATNRDIEPAMASSFEVKNYFMITDTFLSLQSRFGFHFCTLEALLGDVAEENYVSFRFKGGAADLDRRILRAELVADILEEYGFRTELRQDALLARAEGLPRPELEEKLRILGFVMIHTKQLDMVMKNRRMAVAYEQRLRRDLEIMIGSHQGTVG
ncbi:MAG: phosphoenolpyruvate synthase [Pseudodesulfovibrio sp.]|uniref:Phosphoenolpyruvate synthase n=1 Tax=Pseudodesulfovibrio aespoeensis (strain ATCC 700646 / DSM 10631 / Aspo-2) TaxID=643562 RepID=E6VUL0_PSEA9|nr:MULTISPECIES: PEP/pyruvate-binding domain-containing protein [Pseudodesulfovibrio]MBU4475798.1 phosphoenolpyruvate synthase [Pseudomonadota bacterium]ADU61155.1 Pyruvate, water dikinase [Pseudodesulfovibrio aespoeensis Aspo-2]MBU4517419.1 phosphoenolpyruvate synthase [Pseudomonadota bacterium]MBU4522584.1 phosphoenolpyruvate synthase [Pseudomonadota bacterium]MBU4557627.1 phosphoenolpyruvate synthase [Pseudomonadota bacterium]